MTTDAWIQLARLAFLAGVYILGLHVANWLMPHDFPRITPDEESGPS